MRDFTRVIRHGFGVQVHRQRNVYPVAAFPDAAVRRHSCRACAVIVCACPLTDDCHALRPGGIADLQSRR